MKKDPLTQMSINSFFSASAIKTEPQDDSFEEDYSHSSKRRKVEVSNEANGDSSDTHFQRVVVKNEPDYDSDAKTDKAESDDEMDDIPRNAQPNVGMEIDINIPMKKQDYTLSQDVPMDVHNIKGEIASDVETDEATDDEDTTQNYSRTIKTEPGITKKPPAQKFPAYNQTNQTHPGKKMNLASRQN